MPKPLIPARFSLNSDGVPFSTAYDDVYHSSDGGFGQAQHVFLSGNGLPLRWQNRESFTILETGFGLGLNFLATWAAYRADPNRPARLHFVSVEKHPFSAKDLQELHKRWLEYLPLSTELIQHWPSLIGGFHRLHLDRGRITLTLLFGDALDLLPQLEATADAFFLDGFSPVKNPDLWSPALFRELARLAGPGATLATYTVASIVRDALSSAGFVTEKIPGFGRKREMLTGYWNIESSSVSNVAAAHAIVIGAGLSGTFCAERLAARGWTIDLIERHSTPAQEASGNPSGVLQPILHMGETVAARLSRTAFLYAVRHLQALQAEGHDIQWGGNGSLSGASKIRDEARLAQIVEHHAFPTDFVSFVDTNEATRLAGVTVSRAGYWFPQGAWVSPPSLCAVNLDRHAVKIDRHMSVGAFRLEKTTDDQWRVWDERNVLLAEAPKVILANAVDCKVLAQAARQLPLHGVRGQVTYLPEHSAKRLTIGITGDGYIAPMPNGGYCIGATFQHYDTETAPRTTDHAENLAQLEALIPGFATGLRADTLQGRVAWRTTTPDRLPIFGAVQAGLYVATGLGSRGLLWAPLSAEILAAKINGEPWPVEKELALAIDPVRFATG